MTASPGPLIDWLASCPTCGRLCRWFSYRAQTQAPPVARCHSCNPDAMPEVELGPLEKLRQLAKGWMQ